MISVSIRAEVSVEAEPPASALAAGSLEGGSGARIRSTGDTLHETHLAVVDELATDDRNRRMRNRTYGGVGGRLA